jgi:hypothetical protein
LWAEAIAEDSQVPSTCKTVSGRAIHKTFSADNFFKANDNNNFGKILPDREFIFLPVATLKVQEATVKPQS